MTSRAHRKGAVGTIASMLYLDVRRPFWQRLSLWYGVYALVWVGVYIMFW